MSLLKLLICSAGTLSILIWAGYRRHHLTSAKREKIKEFNFEILEQLNSFPDRIKALIICRLDCLREISNGLDSQIASKGLSEMTLYDTILMTFLREHAFDQDWGNISHRREHQSLHCIQRVVKKLLLQNQGRDVSQTLKVSLSEKIWNHLAYTIWNRITTLLTEEEKLYHFGCQHSLSGFKRINNQRPSWYYYLSNVFLYSVTGNLLAIYIIETYIIGFQNYESGLTQRQLDNLPTQSFESSSAAHDHPTCDICFIDYKNDDIITILPCIHIFHKDCVDKWFTRRSSCPFCRYDVTKDL